MNKVIVVIEKVEQGFHAYCENGFTIDIVAPNIEILKRKVDMRLAGLVYKKINSRLSSKYGLEVCPRVIYNYDVAKLLVDIQPYVKHKALAELAGLTTVSLSYYLNGKRSPCEGAFLKILQALKDVTIKLIDLSYG